MRIRGEVTGERRRGGGGVGGRGNDWQYSHSRKQSLIRGEVWVGLDVQRIKHCVCVCVCVCVVNRQSSDWGSRGAIANNPTSQLTFFLFVFLLGIQMNFFCSTTVSLPVILKHYLSIHYQFNLIRTKYI